VETGKADWARWGMQRGGGSTEEAQGMGRGAARRGRGAVGDRRWRGGVRWADRNDDAGRKRRSEHQGMRTGRADRVARRATRAGVSEGRRPGQMS
jgi:hypothetical protein